MKTLCTVLMLLLTVSPVPAALFPRETCALIVSRQQDDISWTIAAQSFDGRKAAQSCDNFVCDLAFAPYLQTANLTTQADQLEIKQLDCCPTSLPAFKPALFNDGASVDTAYPNILPFQPAAGAILDVSLSPKGNMRLRVQAPPI
jgi:hypothetical protein